ncbi:MAG TPA: cobalamin biosynthesis protein CbiG [Lachnospiraceae bacterium]|nr:cobalt-precorrin 5A hydrolase [Lachnospiraceae bacterium]MDD7664675.1 cobalt-precorrin 5A hydrolase [Lachnospiraceae bacterium]MDY4164817.1 cobalt-precorrin 5A hydrolase [Lachnospiraceae bacterium]HAP04013.1 cobalamin biosynthesis protein CbiG [Lachnospiraceae bacterium]
MIKVIFFTENGRGLAERIPDDKQMIDGRAGRTEANIEEAFSKKIPLVFVGAAGIAVRLIAPYIKDKTTDPAVICIDEKGKFVIPLLSGHIGGANELASRLASELGATAVITTATDVNHTFAVDVFAKNNGLGILNPSAIKNISSKVLNGEIVSVKSDSTYRLYQEDYKKYMRPVQGNDERPDIAIVGNDWLVSILNAAGIDPFMPLPERFTREELLLNAGISSRCLYLYEKNYTVGIGCRKLTGYDEIFPFLKDVMSHKNLCMACVDSIASIDIKKDEPGLLNLSAALGVPFNVYSAEELKGAEGNFKPSPFVESVVGVDNVCERAAALSAGHGSKKLVGKMQTERVTISVYEKGSR